MAWQPPGKDCGACGSPTCEAFIALVRRGGKSLPDCVFYPAGTPASTGSEGDACYTGRDVLGGEYDFILNPLPGEVSARKIILPFRPDLVEKWEIASGDIVVGRPAGAGCPVQHVLSVIHANPVSGLLTCLVVGPRASRGGGFKEIEAYHIVGFEGIARTVRREPTFGMRQRFLPGHCMMNLTHTGVVNMILAQSSGLRVRVEDIRL
ncbi:Fe-S cluster protein [Methanoculleus sp. Afa-1]|uniref:Fe-S cluster protein n=1 Tax=Methanoculleus formosensis TaxID=2590886 RepID=A0A9E4ZJ90_9EURY|nr:(Fe-S)-binding protein [Methanoculleus sp. Afa-1]MCT8336084.1 Fe-S cluster protein [Methanoculleus sp. Afa-1]